MAKNDFTATAGISLEQWQKDIANMDSSMMKMEARSQSLEKNLEKVGSALKQGAAAAALVTLGNALANGAQGATAMTAAMQKLDTTGYGATAESAEKFGNSATQGMREALGAVGSIISKVPVLGQVWDLATSHWTNTANFEVGVRDTQKLINLSATGVEGLSAKYMQLTERRKAVYDSNVFSVKGGSDLKDQELWKIDQERARVAYQISAAVKDNLIASNSLLSGSEKATKLKQAELATEKEIADIENSGKDEAGNTSNDMANAIALQKKGAKLKLEAQKQGINAEEEIAKIEDKKNRDSITNRAGGSKADEAEIAYKAAIKEHEIAKKLTVEAERAAKTKKQAAAATAFEARAEFDMSNLDHGLARDTAKLRLDGVEGQVEGAMLAVTSAKEQEVIAQTLTAEAARAAKTKRELAYAELSVQQRNMSLSQIQTTQSEDDAEARKEIYTLELNSAKNAQKAAATERDLHKAGSEAFRKGQVAVDLAKRREEVALFALANQKMEIANAINLTEIQMSGTARVAAIEQNRVQFANQIAKALHEGDNALANQLGKQQAMNDLQAEANELLKTPAQKAKEAKEQRKNEAALRVAAARDKMRGAAMDAEDEKLADDNQIAGAHGMAEKMFKGEDADAINKERAVQGLPPLETINRGGTRSGTRGSEATRKAIKDAEERNAPKNVNAAQNQINEFKAQTLIVTAVKSR
jgi:hypothetical protein